MILNTLNHQDESVSDATVRRIMTALRNELTSDEELQS